MSNRDTMTIEQDRLGAPTAPDGFGTSWLNSSYPKAADVRRELKEVQAKIDAGDKSQETADELTVLKVGMRFTSDLDNSQMTIEQFLKEND